MRDHSYAGKETEKLIEWSFASQSSSLESSRPLPLKVRHTFQDKVQVGIVAVQHRIQITLFV